MLRFHMPLNLPLFASPNHVGCIRHRLRISDASCVSGGGVSTITPFCYGFWTPESNSGCNNQPISEQETTRVVRKPLGLLGSALMTRRRNEERSDEVDRCYGLERAPGGLKVGRISPRAGRVFRFYRRSRTQLCAAYKAVAWVIIP